MSVIVYMEFEIASKFLTIHTRLPIIDGLSGTSKGQRISVPSSRGRSRTYRPLPSPFPSHHRYSEGEEPLQDERVITKEEAMDEGSVTLVILRDDSFCWRYHYPFLRRVPLYGKGSHPNKGTTNEVGSKPLGEVIAPTDTTLIVPAFPSPSSLHAIGR